jgi:acyl-CoA thioester hydrolase
MHKNYHHSFKFLVRDYECDYQGVVNNAVYQNYLEHARNELFRSLGINFAKMHAQGKDVVITKVELNYKYSLRSCDEFVVKTRVTQQGKIRFVFEQDIFRLPDEKIILNATVTLVWLQSGRPALPAEFAAAFAKL